MENQNKDAGFLPGWTVLLSLAGCAAALAILWTCRNAGLSWSVGVPVAVAVVVGGVLLERAIERKYLPSTRND
jgi:hypothetical protein